MSTGASGALSGMPWMHEQAAVVPDIEHIRCPYQFLYGRDMSEEEFGVTSARWLEDRILEIGRMCRKYDMLLVMDEVITGFGRTGKWFASELMEIEQVA